MLAQQQQQQYSSAARKKRTTYVHYKYIYRTKGLTVKKTKGWKREEATRDRARHERKKVTRRVEMPILILDSGVCILSHLATTPSNVDKESQWTRKVVRGLLKYVCM